MYQHEMFPIQQDGIAAAHELLKDTGRNPEKTFPVGINLFRMKWTNSIQYDYELPAPQTSADYERKLLERGWVDMKKHLVHFVICLLVENFPLKARDENCKLVQLNVCHVAEITAQNIQDGQIGPVKKHHRVTSAYCVNGAIFQQSPEIKAEWLRCCLSSVVVTNYNFRVYRIQQVHLDMNPFSAFTYLQRGSGGEKFVEITDTKFLEAFYEKSVAFKAQALLEAYPRKAKVLKQIKASPQERRNVMENELPEALKEGRGVRSLRNGVQCPVSIDQWLRFYPQTDEPVLEIWLRSLQDVARVALDCELEEPTKVCCSDQLRELQSKIIDNITPSTQLMVLLIPNKSVRKVYHSFKHLACEQYPCISQVVRSDTIRKRQSIGSILHKVVQQINAKLCGPLWQIIPKDSKAAAFVDFKKRPFMIFGIDVYLTFEGARWLGISATLDKVFSQYYSMAAELEKGSMQRWRTSLSVELQRLFRYALNAFTDCNDGILPETIVVYRASVNQEEWPLVDAKRYAPKIVVIGIARKTDMRIFKGDKQNIRNPEPGTVVDDPIICPGPTREFFLLSQAVAKGSAVPTHYTAQCEVMIYRAELSLQLIENLTSLLCLMYYNVPNAVLVPAPVLYATKIAAFCGNVIKKAPRPRLSKQIKVSTQGRYNVIVSHGQEIENQVPETLSWDRLQSLSR
ncbi:Piwil1 [Symbiodinium sp. CCMP2456]|nr:Piwil1 [Symbiodinium sp. CCMP2456]